MLDRVADQPQALTLLRRALVAGRVAHAYAFVGPAGAGRTTTALGFAAALLCEGAAAGAGDGCGACRACALVAARQHPDLHVVVPTPPETNPKGARAIRIAAIRELERRAALRPVRGRRQVFLLDDADRMTGEAPQAFLKVLEEPPGAAVMILVLRGVRAVPATVLSRCQLVRFRPRADARAAVERAEALDLLDTLAGQGVDALLRKTAGLDRERAEALVDACWLLCRDLLLAYAGAPARLLGHGERALALARERPGWTLDRLLGAIATCREARRALARNVSPRLTVETLLSRLADRAA